MRIAIEPQRPVFFKNFVNRGAQTVFVIARFGGDRVGDGRLGNLNALEDHAAIFLTQGIAGERVLELGDDTDIAGAQLRNGLHGFAEGRGDVREPLIDTRPHVIQMRVVFDRAGSDFEESDAPGEGVGRGFEDKSGGRLARRDRLLDLLAVFGAMQYAAFERRRQNLRDE